MGKDIGWAIKALKHLYRVRRPHWGAGFYVFMTQTNVPTLENSHNTVEEIYIVMPSLGRIQPFTCHHDDLLAADWQLAE